MSKPTCKEPLSFSYTITIRLAIPDRPGMFAKIASAIARTGASLGAVDLVSSEAGTKIRDVTVESGLISVSATLFPATICVVCAASQWKVVTGVTSGRWRLTTTLLNGATLRVTGSLTAGAPGGMTIADRPLNVRALEELATIAEPWSASATCAAPILSGVVPYSLDRTTRTRWPPILTAAVWRMV